MFLQLATHRLSVLFQVDTEPLLDFTHIGLQFQVEHHLYPRLPRHNLRLARKMVQEVTGAPTVRGKGSGVRVLVATEFSDLRF